MQKTIFNDITLFEELLSCSNFIVAKDKDIKISVVLTTTKENIESFQKMLTSNYNKLIPVALNKVEDTVLPFTQFINRYGVKFYIQKQGQEILNIPQNVRD